MNRMNLSRVLIPVFLWAAGVLPAVANKNEKAAAALARRIVPRMAENIRFEQLPAKETPDVFELESEGAVLIIRGNSANSMAVGLNHYLKYYCRTSVSWYASDPVELPDVRPAVEQPVRITARTDKRFFLNYCTFGYTMPWWQWEDWERLIDWMALNGVNMPLAITGQEAIWYNVWRRLGLTDREIRAYFTGPAYLPWHRMANIDSWLGNLPGSWIRHQAALQKKIIARERELTMTPVLPAFAGHVPPALKRIYPEAKMSKLSGWGGFREAYHARFLDPMDPLFAEIQRAFLKEQERMYGTDHVYGADPFNEMQPPSWEPDYLATVSRTIYETMRASDPEAVWLQMTWLFYFDRKHWTNPRIDAFVNAVPQNKMILLDYFAEHTEVWRQTERYFGQPYLWCYLGNFGGNTMLTGNIKDVGKRIENTFAGGGTNFRGVGSTLEEFGVNPLMYEYVFDKAWNHALTDEAWIDAWADRRSGESNAAVRRAWRTMLDRIYVSTAQLGQGALTNTRPCLEKYGTWTTRPGIGYDNRVLFDVWEGLLDSCGSRRTSYVYDAVNIGRQVLSNYFMQVRDRFAQAYRKKDQPALLENGLEMLSVLDDLDRLLASHSSFLFGKWLQDASRFGENAEEQAYYRKNARYLLTVWGEAGSSLNDYANRSWSGLTAGYYRMRWMQFIRGVCIAVEQGKAFDQRAFDKKMIAWEKDFAENDFMSADRPRTDGIEIARKLKSKYKERIINR